LLPNFGGTGMVKTLAMKKILLPRVPGKYSARSANSSTPSSILDSTTYPRGETNCVLPVVFN
jgi:hypothetical protein